MNKFKEKKVAVIGFGIEGKDAIKYLLKNEALVTLFDKKNESELDLSEIEESSVRLVCGENYLEGGLNDFDYIVRSPGVHPFTKELVSAKEKGAIITSTIRIFFDECPSKIIGVTGTKGKGTTSTLIYEILRASKKDTYLVGNIGKPSLEILPVLDKDSWIVMELSSFQLMDLDKSPHIAVVLNITEDHLDWHEDRDEYIEAKKNIVRFQDKNDYAVLNDDYDLPRSFYKYTKAQVSYFSKYNLGFLNGEKFTLRGEHNLENICAALHATEIVGVPRETIKETIINFKGLEHRLELVAEVDGVTYYNDSFATGPQPTIAAINSFEEPETLILGGSDKGLSFDELRKVIEEKYNVKNLILIGEIGEKIGGGILGKNIINLGDTTMNEIVSKAKEITPKGGVVILSPAAASFDMFTNYKDRGNQFKESVLKLKDSLI